MTTFRLFFLFLSFQLMANSDFEKAEQLFQREKFSEAKVLFENFLKSNPNHTKTLEYLGDIAGKEKKWDEAISYYKKILVQFPKNADYHYKYGAVMGMKAKESNKFSALGLLGEIENSFLTAAKLDSKHISARWALVILYVELPSIVGGSETKAQQYANELMNLSKVDGFLAKGYIDEYFQRYDLAEVNLKKAHAIGNSITTYQKLYNLYQNKLKQPQKALELKKKFEK
ncbi:tetratricopeptide repeat protein [Flavobacterium sp.]|uniref:tetratricopeptide repeat protein n=1 Tax=Flavobacterium sp. TaxID=239 RepID=UPI003526D150